MKKLMLLFALALPMAAHADYLDVIAGKLNPGCTMDKYLQIVQDFRDQWVKDRGYTVEILVPVQSRDLGTFFWVGRISNAEAFGKGFDEWIAGQSDPNSVSGKLSARLRECVTMESRAGYFTR